MAQDRPVILMVEDEDAVLQTNARMMRRRGYSVHHIPVNCEFFLTIQK